MKSNARRVYTFLGVTFAVLAVAAAAGASDVTLTVDGAMVKGSPAAPVTIVEFSDYQ